MRADDAPALPPTEPFRLGDRTVYPQRNRIRGPAAEVHLEPRVMDVLCVLAARAGEVMSRESLIERVWAVQYGGDESLTRAISILRKALGAGAIETIAKRGYRLAVPVEEADPDSAPAKTVAVEEAPSPQPIAAAVIAPAAPPLPPRAYALRQQGRGPNGVFPVASLDFWRLPPVAFAAALALALGMAGLDVALH